jgi:hypothetical protein
MIGVPYNRPQHVRKNLIAEFVDAGILGSASVDIRISGDGLARLLGRHRRRESDHP